MTAITIIVLLLVIGGFIGFAIYLHFKEQARLTKLRKVSTLHNQLRQVRRYIDDMPAQYQPKDMRIWLFSRMLAIYDELIAIQPDETQTRRRTQLSEEIEEFKKSKKKRRAKLVNDELIIVEVKRLFESFKSFLTSSQGDKKIPSDMAERYIKLVDFYLFKVGSDYHAHMARKAFLSGQMESAIELYRQALSELAPIKESPEAQTIILKYEELLKEIEADLALQKSEENINNSADGEHEEDLDNEWNKFIDNSSFKEKKRF